MTRTPSSSAFPRQLLQAKRIAELRERRDRRARIEAHRTLKQRESERDEADREMVRRTTQENAAKSVFFSNPADENNSVWLTASKEQKKAATQNRDSAEAERQTAAECAEISKQQHEKSNEKVSVLDNEIAAILRAARHRKEERALEDSEEQRA